MSNVVALRPCARGARALCPCRISVAINRKPTQCSMPVFAKLPPAAGRRATSASTSCCTKSNLEKLTSLQLRRRARRVSGTSYAPCYMHTGTVGHCTGLHLHIQWSCISPSSSPPPRRSHARLRPPCDTRNAGPTRPFVGIHPQLDLVRGASWPCHGRNISPGACRGACGNAESSICNFGKWQNCPPKFTASLTY